MKKITFLNILLFVFNSNIGLAQLNDSIKLLIPVSHKYIIERLALSNNGRHFATGSNDGYIKIWDAKSSSIIHTLGQRADDVGVGSLCFTPDGKYLLSGSLTIDVWDVTSGQRVKNLDAFTGAYIYSIDISPDSKTTLIASGSSPSLWDIKLGRRIREYKHPRLVHCVKFTKDGTKFLTGCADGIVRLYDSSSDAMIKEFKFTDKEIVAVDFSYDENKVVLADENMVYLCDKNTGKLIKSFDGHPRKDRAVAFTTNDSSLLVSEYKNVRKIDIKTGKSAVVFSYNSFNEVAFSKDRKRALYAIEGTETLYGSTDTRIIDLEYGKTVREFKNRFSPIGTVQFAPDNLTLATVIDRHQIRLLNLSNITGYSVINSSYVHSLSFSPNGKMLAYGHGSISKNFISVANPISTKNIVTFPVENSVTSITFSSDNKLMAAGLASGEVHIIDMTTRSTIYHFKAISDFITRFDFSIDNDYILVTTPRSIELRNISRMNREWYYPIDKPLNEQKFPKVNLERWAPNARTLLKLCEGKPGISNIQISLDGKTVFISKDESYFLKKDVQSGTSMRYTGHQGGILSLSLSENNKLAASSGEDHTLRIWDNTSGKMLVSYFAIDSSDWFWITPDNYYYSSKNASKVVNFRKNNQIYRFHQFDLQLNRPDLVMKEIGLSSDSLISFYSQLIEKRFRRMGIKKDSTLSSLSVPTINIVNFDSIPDITLRPTISLKIKATSPDDNLKKINIRVNGVPVYNSFVQKNKIVSGKTFQTDLNIPLIEGKNMIEVSCSNQSERESLIESVLVNYAPPVKQKTDLYIFCIGVSEYKKYPGARLRYADKDAQDLVKTFSASALFNKVYAETITNSLANRDNILKIKKKLMKAKTNDLVIVSYSGHGIIDNNLNFYFCTNTINLDRIAATAVSFKEMEDLLDGIPSYKKMLLIDACYSGEVDKEVAKTIIQKSDSTKALHIGDAKLIIPGNVLKLGHQSALELMKESFVELRQKTGTAVISSSSGVDVSYEKDKWKNGLFTYAVLSALSNTNEVDLNGDGIYVSELIPYLIRSVKDLSLGLQLPTIREENMELDFRIW